METRLKDQKVTLLPLDYTKLVAEVVYTQFAEVFDAFHAEKRVAPKVVARGSLGPSEIILALSFEKPNSIAAVTTYASVDYDPKASLPKAEELLGACLDALGAYLEGFLNKMDLDRANHFFEGQWDLFSDIAHEWTEVSVDGRKVFLRVDRANLGLDELTDAWLEANDPKQKLKANETHTATENLFVTGKRVKH